MTLQRFKKEHHGVYRDGHELSIPFPLTSLTTQTRRQDRETQAPARDGQTVEEEERSALQLVCGSLAREAGEWTVPVSYTHLTLPTKA